MQTTTPLQHALGRVLATDVYATKMPQFENANNGRVCLHVWIWRLWALGATVAHRNIAWGPEQR
jgi:hypothetical protein